MQDSSMNESLVVFDDVESLEAHGVLDQDHADTFFVYWDVLGTHLSEEQPFDQCVFVRERVTGMVDRLFSLGHSSYCVTLAGKEPTLYPLLPDLISYLYSGKPSVNIILETDGARDLLYYDSLLALCPKTSAPTFTLDLHIRPKEEATLEGQEGVASAAFISPLAERIALVHQYHQQAHVTLVFDENAREACVQCAEALKELRSRFDFTVSVTTHDLDDILEGTTSLQPCGTAACYEDSAYAQTVAVREDAFPLLLKDFYCCLGLNFLYIAPNGQFAPAYGYPMKKLGFWDAGEKTLARLVKIVPFQDAFCTGPNLVIPKFKSREAAEKWQDQCLKRLAANKEGASKKRRLPQTEDIVRARLKRISAKSPSTPCPADPTWVERNFASLCTLYTKLKDAESRDLVLSAFQCLATGDSCYLPSPQALPEQPSIPGEVVFVDDAQADGILINASDTVDSLILAKQELCSRITLLHENAISILEGSVRTLADYQPALRITTRNLKDLLTIPLWLLEHTSDYTLSLRRTSDETVTITAEPKEEPVRHRDPESFPHPVISCIIPVGDDDEELSRCVKSILCQDRTDVEVILVTSNTYSTGDDCVASFVREYPKIVKSIRLDEEARSAQLNAGLTMALGTYCTVLDPKDTVAWEFLPKSCEYIQAESPDILAFDRVFYAKDVFEHVGVEAGSYAGTESLEALLSGKTGPWLGHESLRGKLFNREYLQNRRLRFLDLGDNTDLAFALAAHVGSRKTLVVPECACFTEKDEDESDTYTVDNEPLKVFAAFAAWYSRFCSEHGFSQEEYPFSQVLEQAYATQREQLLSSLTFDTDEESLSDDILRQISGSKALFCSLLKDYALLYCQRENLDLLPLVRPDWEREAEEISSAVSQQAILTSGSLDSSPKLSVILTVTNASDDLSRTLESIISQYPEESQDYECIVSCAPEHADMLQALADCDPSIRLAMLEKKCDANSSRTIALNLVQGQYVIFVDEGDICLPGFFAHAVQQIESTEANLVCFGCETIDSRNNVLSSREVTENFYGEEHCEDFLTDQGKELSCYGMIFDAVSLAENAVNFQEGETTFLTSFVLNAESIVCDPTVVYQHKEVEEVVESASYTNLKAQYKVLASQTEELSDERISIVLLNIAAFWQVMGSVPMTQADFEDLTENTYFVRHLLTGYAKLYEECDDEKSILSTPEVSLQSFDVTKSVQPYVSIYNPECMPSEEELAALKKAPKLFSMFMEDYATRYCEDYRQLDISSFENMPKPQRYETPDYLIPAPSNQTKECLLSIIIVTRNSAETLDRCLESFTSEKVDQIECIVVDDASDCDNSYLKAIDHQVKDARIRLFRTPWFTGAGQARNLGFGQANGQWVLFLDPKDWLCEGFQTQIVPLLSSADKSVGLFDLSWKAYSDDNGQLLHTKTQIKNSEIDAKSAFTEWIKNPKKSGLWSVIVRKDADFEVIIPNVGVVEDFFLLVQLYTSVTKIKLSTLQSVSHIEKIFVKDQVDYPTEKRWRDTLECISEMNAYLLSRGYGKGTDEYKNVLSGYVEGASMDIMLRYMYLNKKIYCALQELNSLKTLMGLDMVVEKCIFNFKKLIRGEIRSYMDEEE